MQLPVNDETEKLPWLGDFPCVSRGWGVPIFSWHGRPVDYSGHERINET
jgi:hypothetical protein